MYRIFLPLNITIRKALFVYWVGLFRLGKPTCSLVSCVSMPIFVQISFSMLEVEYYYLFVSLMKIVKYNTFDLCNQSLKSQNQSRFLLAFISIYVKIISKGNKSKLNLNFFIHWFLFPLYNNYRSTFGNSNLWSPFVLIAISQNYCIIRYYPICVIFFWFGLRSDMVCLVCVSINQYFEPWL